jgi:hypothetical protein
MDNSLVTIVRLLCGSGFSQWERFTIWQRA